LREPDGPAHAVMTENRLYNLVQEATEKEIISLNRAAEILNKSNPEMRELANSREEIIIITDANVLIDFATANINVLKLLTSIFKEVCVPIDIAQEVNELNISEIQKPGIRVYYPDTETCFDARNINNGISFEDNICITEAHKNGWAVATSDKKMKEKCEAAGVSTLWVGC